MRMNKLTVISLSIVVVLLLALGVISGEYLSLRSVSLNQPISEPLMTTQSSTAQSSIDRSKKLLVGVVVGFPPFSDIDSAGKPWGIVVDLFRTAADLLKYQYEFTPASGNIDKAVHDLSIGKFDVLIGPVSVNYSRMQMASFTHPFFLNKIGLVIPDKRVTFWSVLSDSLGTSIKYVLFIILIAFTILTHFFWYFERGSSQECERNYFQGMGYAAWTMLSTFLQQVLYDPRRLGARAVMTIWLMFSMLVVMSVTALVTSSLTVSMSIGGRDYQAVTELMNTKIAVIDGTIEVNIVKRLGAYPILVKNIREGIDAVNAKKVDSFMNDYYIMQYQLMKESDIASRMSNLVISNDDYAFVIPKNSPLERPLSLAITDMQDKGTARMICNKYIMDGDHSCEF